MERAYFQVPELRGFEKFAEGRPAEDMPQITSRICGVCPTAHHMAATKALDALYQVDPPPAAKKIRELVYSAFMVEDHALHFYFLGGPDFVVGPDAPGGRAQHPRRHRQGRRGGRQAGHRHAPPLRELITTGRRQGRSTRCSACPAAWPSAVTAGAAGGDPGAARPTPSTSPASPWTSSATVVLGNPAYVDLIVSDAYTHRTYYMGLVDEKNRLNFYDGQHPRGRPGRRRSSPSSPRRDYLDHIAEHVEPWTLHEVLLPEAGGLEGLHGRRRQRHLLAWRPLARLNAADGMATPLAQEAYEEYVRHPRAASRCTTRWPTTGPGWSSCSTPPSG